MSSREKILEEIKNNKPFALPMPVVNFADSNDSDLKEKFSNTLTGIGGICISVENNQALKTLIELKIAEGLLLVQTIKDLPGYNAEEYLAADAASLQHVSTVYIQGMFGVAENGSVWVSEKAMANRMLPFICEHLVLVINQQDIVATMHHAYEIITFKENGYGTFIAGPSKTADIEQSLVIGAHGPLSLQVVIIDKQD